jgi:CBS domain-containing protein
MSLPDPISSILKQKGASIVSISPTATVYDALALMAGKQVGALLVMSDSKLVGIISERDYARKVVLMGRLSKDTKVVEIMSSPVIFVSPSHSVGDCMSIITENRIRHLPVMEGDKVAGMISIGDLVNWIITSQQEKIRHLEAYITGTPS